MLSGSIVKLVTSKVPPRGIPRALQAAGGLRSPHCPAPCPKWPWLSPGRCKQGPPGTDVSALVLQFSRGQEQHWWIGLHTYENDGRFK